MKEARKKRPIDELASESYSWWKRTFISIKKTEVRTWKMIFIIAFIFGVVSAIILVVAFNWQSSSDAAGMANIFLSPKTVNVKNGDVFKVEAKIDTRGNKVVVVEAEVNYDKNYFQLEGWDIDKSDFMDDNACIEKGDACKIIKSNPADGKIIITLAKPTPGVNTHTGNVAVLRFKALKETAPEGQKISVSRNSSIILDDGHGTNILADVQDATVAVGDLVCTAFTYYSWNPCGSDGKQTRAVLMRSPAGCVGGNPILEQDCTPPVVENDLEEK